MSNCYYFLFLSKEMINHFFGYVLYSKNSPISTTHLSQPFSDLRFAKKFTYLNHSPISTTGQKFVKNSPISTTPIEIGKNSPKTACGTQPKFLRKYILKLEIAKIFASGGHFPKSLLNTMS